MAQGQRAEFLAELRRVGEPDEVLDLTRRLVQIPSHWDQLERERPIAAFLKAYFDEEGIEAQLQPVMDDRPNVIAKLVGHGNGKSLMLNGHIDTVPPYGMENPFDGRVTDGKLFGRGATDMKAGVASMAYALVLLKRAGICLKGDLVFAGVIDEDAAGSAGTRHIVSHGPHADYAIVGEPTNLHPAVAHKGMDNFQISFVGRSVHSSVPNKGINAIIGATTFVQKIHHDLVPQYESKVHPLVGAPTVNIDLIQGGAQANIPYLEGRSERFAGIVADQCRVYLDVRRTPHQSLTEVKRDLMRVASEVKSDIPGLEVTVEYLPWPHPAMEIEVDSSLVKSVYLNTKQVIGRDQPMTGVSYWADSGLLYGLGQVPTLVFGPGDIQCAHSDIEWVEVDELFPAACIYALTASDVCQ